MKKVIAGIWVLGLLLTSTAHAEDIANISWIDGNEQQHDLQQYRGKPVLLHFWAAWCGPCRTELPHLVAWDQRHTDIQVIYLSLDQRIGQTKYFIDQSKVNIPPLLANQNEARSLGIRGLPSSLLLDIHGHIIQRMVGEQDWQSATMDNLLNKL